MISIVIPVYNGEKHIPAMLGCLRAQTASGMAFEAVFVNDGSADGSLALLRQAQTNESFPVVIIDQQNGGVSAARNAGIRAAQGEYLAFADVDDLLAPNYISLLSEYASSAPDVLRFGFCRVDGDAQAIPSAQNSPAGPQDVQSLLADFLADPKRFGPYGFLFSRAFLQKHALLFAQGRAYYEDYDFIVRAAARAQRLMSADAVLYGYRQAAGSAMMRFNANRVSCLALADELTEDLFSIGCPAAASFAKWYKARLYWAVLWQACMALPSPGDARRFLHLTNGRALLARLKDYPSRKVALTALLALASPEAYALLARKLGGGRSFLQRMRPDEARALFAEIAPSGKDLPA